MEPVKLASGIGGHGPQILYPGGRQPPPGHPVGNPIVHPNTTRPHEGSPYKETISPSVLSRGGPYASYAPVVDGGAPRYLQQPAYLTYQRDSHYPRSMSDRPFLLPHNQRRPSIMGGYTGFNTRDFSPQMVMNPSLDVSACKKMKLNQPIKSDSRFTPLVVDTENANHTCRETSYYPQVEAISPTLPLDPRDESPLHTTQDDILKQIQQVDKEIAMREASISNLEKKEKELLTAAQKGDSSSQKEAEDTKEIKHQSTAQIIYAENRKKAEEGHNSLAKLIPQSDAPRVLPLYHQPSDAEVYQENKRKFVTFKQHLLEYFKRRQSAKTSRDQQLAQTYTKLMIEWTKWVDKIENSKKHKEKVAKNRELFEKVFPELRKQREDKERFSRVGARVKSDAEMEEIIDGLQDQENEDKKMRAYAVIPPILLDERQRLRRYITKNGIIEDPIGEYKEQKNVNIWTEHEMDIFKDKFLQHPKNFVVISSYLERKSVSDSIQNFYFTKKKENYKLLVKRRLRRPRNKGSAQTSVESIVALNASSGVTTRGSAAAQKELMKNGPSLSCSSGSSSIMMSAMVDDEKDVTVNGADIPMSSHPSGAQNWTQSANSSDGDMIMGDVSGDTGLVTITTSTTTSNDGSKVVDSIVLRPMGAEVREKDKENLAIPCEKLVRRERTSDDSSDEDAATEQGRGGLHACVVCRVRLEHYGQSRSVTVSKASQYGFTESTLPPNARVCTTCMCRSYRRKISQCPIPSCLTAKWRVKRLRPFPSAWNHLAASVKEPIVKELQIPSDVTKSCSSCHNRILRKLGSEVEEPVDPSRWSQEEVDCLRGALKEVGCHWSRVSEKVGTKSQGQCKSFYYNYKGKCGLDEAVSEYRKSKGKSDPPTVTDEEESGSTTSSCDEVGALPPQHCPLPQVRHDSTSDTASASSPPQVNSVEDSKDLNTRDAVIKEPLPPTGQTPANLKEDNDSSATASADEGQSGAGRDSPPEVQHIPNPGERRSGGHHMVGNSKSISLRTTPLSSNNSAAVSPFLQLGPIIDKTVEVSFAKSIQEKIPISHPNTPSDGITMKSLLENHEYSQKKAARTNDKARLDKSVDDRSNGTSNWGYSTVDHHSIIDPRSSAPAPAPERPPSYGVECEGGLDLTVKKRDRSPPPSSPPVHHQFTTSSHPSIVSQSALLNRELPPMTVRGGAEVILTGKGSPPRAHSNSISYSQNIVEPRYAPDYRKCSAIFSGESRSLTSGIANITTSTVPSPHMGYGIQPTPRQQMPYSKSKPSMAPPPPLNINPARASHLVSLPQNPASLRLSLKAEKSPITLHGSITHGTPVNQHPLASVSQANRFEMVTKPVMAREGGSITQGTPVHLDSKRSSQVLSSGLPKDGMIVEARSGVEIIPRSAPVSYDRDSSSFRGPRTTCVVPTSHSYTAYAYTTRPLYSDSQMSSRQIIETDYLTSQQMQARRGTLIEKDIQISPRGREPGLQPSVRDHRPYIPALPSSDRRNIDCHTRVLDNRVELRPEHSLELRPFNVRTISDNEKLLHKSPYIKGPHGMIPMHNQSHNTPYYISSPDVRVSRPSPSPASVREATPPSTESISPQDFRSPGVSTPTPPPRLSSVIQRRPPCKPTHLIPPKSASPRLEVERYSPHAGRHIIPANMVPEALSITDMMQRQTRYANVDIRRDMRTSSHHSVTSHDGQQFEGIGKQMVDSLQSSRYICDSQGIKDVHPVEVRLSDDRRYYDYNRVRMKEEYRNVPANQLLKEAEDAKAGKIILNYSLDQSKHPPSSRGPGNEPLTTANLIEAIISNQINQRHHLEEPGREGRMYRREVDHPIVEVEQKPARSPSLGPYYQKQEEVVTLEDGSDINISQRYPGHKDGQATIYSSLAHPNHQKQNQVLMEAVVNRELFASDKKLIPGVSHPYGKPPLEITRSDGRTVSHMNLYDPQKIRTSSSSLQSHPIDKVSSPKDRFDSRSPHHMPPSTSSLHIHPSSHMAADERQIIRIAQSQTLRSDNPFDMIKNKLQEIWREDTTEGTDNSQHTSRSGTPLGLPQQQQHRPPNIHPSQSLPPAIRNSSHFEDEHTKKRPRLEVPPESLQRSPSIPRSSGDTKELPREEVADSPQSGEMVIDETPRTDASASKHPTEGSGNPQSQDKGTERTAVRVPVTQYTNVFPPYRVSGAGNQQPHAPGSGSWAVNAPPLSNASATRPQGYEPRVEDVSDDD